MVNRAVGFLPLLALCLGLAPLIAGQAGCGAAVKRTERLPPEKVLPLRTATLEELAGFLRERQEQVRTLNAVAELVPSTGSAYSGVIEEYHDVRAFLLAARHPASPGAAEPNLDSSVRQVRMIGQAPVVRRTIFDMVADEESFRVLIPSKNKFIVGPNSVTRKAKSPIENLRPQHLFDAVFPQAPAPETPLVLEENEFGGARFYALSEIAPTEAGRLVLRRKWWFERSRLELARFQRFDAAGRLVADVRFAHWQEEAGGAYPKQIELARPQDDYRLRLLFKEVKLNQLLEPEKFVLEQPRGTELIDLAQEPLPEEPTSP